MKQKAILIKFDPDATDERIQQIIRRLQITPEVEQVSQPQEFDNNHGDVVIYQP
jgi:hypothetical protein